MRDYLKPEDFRDQYVTPKDGRTLIVGSRLFSEREDRRKAYRNAIGVDMEAGEGVDVVLDLEGDVSSLGKFAHIECVSVLEHSRRPWLLAANLQAMLEPGGTIFVSVPLVWRRHAYPDDYWRILPAGIRVIFDRIDWQVIKVVTQDKMLQEDFKIIPHKTYGGASYLARCETCGFGIKQ